MDYLSAIKVFVTFSQTHSIRKTAKQLCKTEAAISKKLKKLESSLGVELISRDGNQTELTPIGKEYLIACNELLDKFSEIEHVIKEKRIAINKLLKICCDEDLFEQYLLPNLYQFTKSYKQLHLEISNDDKTGQTSPQFDLLITPAVIHESFENLIRKKVLGTHLIICASPDYLKQHNILPLDLHQMVYVENSSLNGTALIAKNYTLPLPSLRFDNTHNAIGAAINGLGFTIAYEYTIKQYLDSKQLIELAKSETELPVYGYYNKDSYFNEYIKHLLKFFIIKK